MRLWPSWLAEGDLPGADDGWESHWMFAGAPPEIRPGDRVYIVAYERLRGYAPFQYVEERCALDRSRRCLVRWAGAEAVTIAEPIRGFQGWRYRWWERAAERPYPNWMTDNVPADIAAQIARQLPAGSFR
jgi:hypothetical protein